MERQVGKEGQGFLVLGWLARGTREECSSGPRGRSCSVGCRGVPGKFSGD